jgi:hypothetical protein
MLEIRTEKQGTRCNQLKIRWKSEDRTIQFRHSLSILDSTATSQLRSEYSEGSETICLLF